MKNSSLFIFRVGFLLVYLSSLVFPLQTVSAATVPTTGKVLSATAVGKLTPASASPDADSAPLASAAPGPDPAPGGYTIASQTDFAMRDNVVVSGPITIGENAPANGEPLIGQFSPAFSAPASSHSSFASGLTITPITAYNVIVDSNVLSPSSYGPNSATLGAKYCNTSTGTLNDVWAFVGNRTANTPGVYPIITPAQAATNTGNAALGSANTTDYGGTIFSLKHAGGSLGISDASRYLGTLQPGECRTEYWLVTYPRIACTNGQPCNTSNPTKMDVTGGVKPDDDLWLQYDFWGKTGATTEYYTRYLTMRNEISAMANKIWPNGDNKVPPEYIAAIQQVTGWSTWTPSGSSVAYPGQVATSQGIWYDFGNIGAGFDNNYDYTPDRNAWVQPIGDAGSYDPGCFRLIKTYGLVIVKLNDGTEMIIPFVDQMYFENIPGNNTGAVGLVYYQYVALDGACSAGLTPYQEVASGYDNEKFNADFGAGIPPLQSQQTNMTIDKTGPASVATNTSVTYNLKFALPESTSPTMFISVGSPSLGMPLVFSDAIPAGMAFIGPVSPTVTMTNYSSATLTANLLYSTDSGATWSSTPPANNTVSDPSTNKQIIIQWWLPTAIDQKTQGGGVVYGEVSFSATSPNSATPPPAVTNTGCLKLGNGPGFTCDSATTLITGAYALSGTVFCDDGTQTSSSGPCSTGTAASTLANGVLDAGGGEPGMPNVSVNLYYDSNGNGSLDATDTLINSTTVTDGTGLYTFSNLPAGTYFTKVIKTDGDIQSTYGLTTPESRKATIVAANVTGLDYGFAPPLSIEKSVDKTVGIGGDDFTYTITLNNNLPGSGLPGNACVYRAWAGQANTSGGTPPGGGPSNSQWQNAGNSTGRPDGQYATTIMANNSDELGLTRFNISDMGGNITSVGYRIVVNELLKFDDDTMVVDIYDGAAIRETDSYSVVGSGTGIETFTGPTGKQYIINGTISWVPTGGWTFSDFSSAVNRFGMRITGNRVGGTSGDLALDAVSFTITTDQICSGADTTLDPVPLTDVFRNDHFTLVSTNPPYDSTSVAGNQTTISWNNVGSIYPGGYKQVTVTLKALDPGPAGVTSINTAQSANAKFANGTNANSPVTDAVTVTVNDTTNVSQITGRIFDDNDGDGWAFAAACTAGTTNPNCSVEAGDTALQGIKVNLLACVNTSTNALVTAAGSNKTCIQQGGEWRIVASQFTDSTGQYLFTLLPQGFYRVQVDTTTLPGSANTADPNVSATNGTPFVCASCDNQTYGDLRLDNITFGAITGANSFYSLNFGYNIPSGTFNVGDTIYYDWNGNGVQDAGDEGIDGAIVQLIRADGSVYATSLATVDGAYLFTGVPAGVYTVRVTDSSLPTFVSQTADPDQPATTCSICDNSSTISLTANNLTRDFGYQPSGTAVIGDTVWKDMNGDGIQSGTQETGIANITVNLLTDFDGNGTWVTAKTTTTDASGKYQFANLPNGTYRVQVDTADTDMPKDAFGSNYAATNGSLYTAITVVGGVVTSMTNPTSGITSTTANGFGDTVENDPLNLDADFGFAPLASIGDTVYWDSNANGTQDTGEPGINGVTVRLYTFTDLPDGKYTSGETFTDSNANGRWDAGEAFTDSLGNGRYDPGETLSGSPVATTTTATSNGQAGKYLFTGLDTDKNGVNYVVVVDPTSAPIAASVLNADPSADGVPSNCAAINLSAANCDARDGMKLFPGSNYMGADFGFLPLGSFGDTVWIDANNNGILDAGEHGIPNITVTAVTSTNVTVNGANFPAGTTLTTSTDANGNYFFQNIIAIGSNATWTVTVNTADPDFPVGLTQTYDPDGTLSNSTTVIVSTTGVVTTVGGCGTTPNGCDGETDALNMDADFGYDYSGAGALSGTICLDSGYTTAAANTAGDNVGNCGVDRNDTSGIGAGEAAYDNVTVYLYRWIDGNSNSNIDAGETTQIAVTNTDVNGDFSFTNIPDTGGVYYVVAIGAPQSGMELTTQVNDSPTVGNDPKETVVESNPTVAGVDYADVSAYEIVLVPAGGTVTNVDFAFAPAGSYDYGDLPDTYSTTLQGNPDGPRHLVSATPTLYLGTAVNNTQALLADANGQPSADATGDGADEDGVTFTYDAADTNWSDGVNVTVNVTAYVAATTTGSNNDAYLVAWMDFNHDGDFADSGEMIISRGVENGANSFTVAVPAGTFPSASGTINSRFRLFSNSETPPIPTLAYSGVATSGEVEDYQQKWDMTIDKDTSTATVAPGGTATYTIVLRNNGNQVLSNVQFSDSLPGSGQAWAWTYTAPIVHTETGAGTNLTSDECYDGVDAPLNPTDETDLDSNFNTVTCGKWNIGVGGSVTITLTVTVPSSTPINTYDNTALASSTQTGTIDDDGTKAYNDPTTPDLNTGTNDPEDDEDVTVTRTLTLRKSWSNAIVNNAVTISVIRGGLTIGTLASTANTATETDTAATAIAINAGDVLTFSEAFNTGLAANYTSAISCTGATDTNLADGLTVNAADVAIVCTYTNTRKSATLVLQKTWTNAVVNDTSALSTTGLINNASLGSTADTASETDAGTGVTVYAGETATISETLGAGNSGVYASSLACANATDTDLTGNQLTIDPADSGKTITCTYSNTRIVPPSISKSFSPNPIAEGGTSTLTFTINNANLTAALNGVAFSDTYPVGVVNTTPVVTTNNCGGTLTAVNGGGSISLSGGTITANTGCTITVTVIAAAAGKYPNTTGTVSSTNGGNGNTASATLNVISVVKSIVSTSEASTGFVSGFERVAIGEVVRYRLTTYLPEGTWTNVQITDAIDTGIQFLDDGTATVTYTCNGACTNSTFTTTGGPFGSATDPTFNLGTVTNPDSDANAEYLIVEFNALVLNMSSNSAGGATRTNAYTISFNGTTFTSPAVGVRISEPSITNLSKTVSAGPYYPGNTITYTLTYSNGSTGVTRATAYDVYVTDTLSSNLNLQSVSVTAPTGSVVSNTSTTGVGGVVRVRVDQVAPSIDIASGPTGVTITVTAQIVSGASAGTLSNTANLTYTSLPGGVTTGDTNGTCPNATGSCTPGTSGSTTGERNGSGTSPNTYTGTANVDITVSSIYSISGQVRYDIDNDANFADADSGLASAQVALYTDPNGDGDPADGVQVGATVTTTGTGNYTFSNVIPGNYVVVEVNPTGYTSTADTAAPNNDRIPVVITNANSTGNNFLDTLLLNISGQVRNDVDGDGSFADPDSGLASAQVSLYTDPNGDGDPADGAQVGATVTTTATGNYSFTGLIPGNYVVVEANPAGYASTADTAAPNNDRVPVVLTTTNSTGNDFLDTVVYSVSGQVRYDIDNDANFADADSGLASAQVALYTDPNGDGDPADGAQVGATVTTTGTGNYTFNNVIPGNYVVVEVNPTGYTSTADTAAPNNDRIPVVITNANSTGNNFLDTLLLSISGQVRNDVDSDGNFADPDSGLVSAQVSLYTDPNGDGDPADGAQVGATVTTTATGNYSFTGLIPGNYVVVEANPTGYASTADTAAPNNDRIPVVLTTTSSTGNDFLDTIVYSVSGQVRYDIDNDANFADADSGLASAQVALYTDPNGDGDPADGVQVGTTVTTTGTGNYTFNNVIPGNYVVVEVNPTGYTSTADTAAPNNDRIPVVITNANSTGNNFLDTLLLSISGQVRNDVDSDGSFADPDSGLASAQVSLYTDPNGDGDPADGAQVGTTVTTTATGNYSFTGLIPGNYVVVEVNPTGYTSTADTAAPNNDRIPVVLTTTNSTGNDFLDTAGYFISGQVRYDIDNDANFADADSGLASAQVALYTDPNGDGNPADGVQVGATVTTTGTGNYTFNNVIPGNYVVVEVNPAGYTSTADTAAPNNDRIPVVITNASSSGNDFLDTLLLNISGQVRNDLDSDGSFADPDSGLASAQVSLYTDPNGDGDPADGAQVGATVTTTATGNYSFTGLIPGNYVVVEANPAGYASTADTAAPNNDRVPVVLTTTNSTGNDFLDTVVYSVSGQVRYDIDNDANFADADSGLASAQVALYTDPNGDGNPADGVQVGATVTTTGTGNYTFNNVIPGNYVVVEVNPTGYTSTADTAAPNNDRIPVVITNANSTGNNFLDTLLLNISGQVRNDVDGDGSFADPDSGLASAQVSLYTDPNGDGDPADGAQVGTTVTTTATGNYSFTGLIPGNYVVVEVNPTGYASTADIAAPNNDRVPVTLTNTNSTGNDFLDTIVYSVSGQVRYDIDNDANFADADSGLASAQVALYTDPNGDGDPSDGVQVGATVTTTGTGNYTFNNVVPGNYVVVEVNPTGYTSTADTAAPNNDRIPVVITNANSTGNNFLDTLLLSISGQVRNDTDADGVFADPDSGLASAQVSLYTDPNGDGDPADGAQVGVTQTTTGTGNYSFTNLLPGNYVVVEVNPTGYASTADTAAPNNDRVPVVLTTTNSTGNDFLDTVVYSVSGQVRYDIDNDANFADADSGLASAQVALYTDPNGDGDPSDGVQVGATVTTTGTGNYTFNNVIPGNYVVVEVNPTGYTSTADTAAPNNDRIPVVITNANSTGNNFLDTLLLNISGQVRNDVDSDGSFADPDSGLASAQVSLYTDPNGDGDPADGAQVGATVTTTATGNYNFTGLIPGNYVVVEVNPTGYASTADSAAPNNDRIPVVLTTTSSTGNDFLDTAVYSVSGQVRYDIDNDANFADADSGLASAQVALYTDPNGDGDPADGVQVGATVTTTGTGNYTFNNVIPGNYVVVEVNPTGYTSTADTAAPNNDRIPVVITNANSTGNNFLDTLLLSISGQVRNDVDSDGSFADPDGGLASAQVSLYTDPNGDGDPADGAQVGATVTTTATGNYSFTGLIPGNYVVVEANPTGYVSTADTAAPNNDRIPVVLTTTSSTGNDFLDTAVYSVSGQVRYDIDNDANFADADSGLASAQVALYTDPNGDGDPADGAQVGATVTTTGTGNYTFNNVIPGNYVVVEVNPTGYTSTADTAAPNNDHIPVVITNANSTGNNFLDTLLLSISGQVRNDVDSDGNFADPDSGLVSTQVSLYTDPNGDGDPADGAQVGATVTTTATGNYSFTGLIPGNYVVVEANPTGYASTADTAAPNNDRIPVVLTTTNSTGNDFLDTVVYSVSGQVRYDIDNDGSFADPDSGLASAQVSLYTDPNGDGDPADGVQVGATVTTTGTGNYTFNNVIPGNYVVVEVNPTGYTSTADTAAPNNDRIPVVITNANSTGNNFLDTLLLSISGQVRNDVDSDGSFADPDSGLASAQVSLYTDPNGDGDPADGAQVGATVTTTATGNYSFTGLIPGNYVVVEVNPTGYASTADTAAPNNDRVPVVLTTTNSTGNDFLDTVVYSVSGQVRYDIDNDANFADPDSGLASAQVALYTDPNGDGDPADGAQVGATVTTTGTGNYTFNNVIPGNYVVVEVNPTGYTSTADTAAPNNDRIPVVITNANSTGNDFLDTLVYSVSGQIRYDTDNDGSFADPDGGLASAQVALYTDPNGDGDPSDGVQVGATFTTTGTGNYTFNNVIPGNYVVVEVNPAGYTSTADTVGANNDRVPVVITNANSTGNNFLDTLLLSISGQVRNDVDNNGNLADPDSGLASAQVSLYTDPNGDGNPADGVQVGATVTTTGTGNYSFTGLLPGNYVVVEVNPTGYVSTADSAGPNNDRVPVVLTNANSTGNVFLDWINAQIQIVKTPSATVINSGGSVTYSYVVTNPGAVSLTSVSVTDDKCSPVTYVSGDTNTNSTLETTETWNYRCTTTLTATTTNTATVTGKDPLNNTIQDIDTATVTVVSSGISKTIVPGGTSETFTTGNNVAIGEIVTYEISIDLPAGLAFNNVVVTDKMDKGLAFVDCLLVDVAGTNVTGTVCNPPATPVVSSITDPGDSPANPANPGRQVQFNIGNIGAPAAASKLTIRYRAIVLDVIENQENVNLNNNVTWAWTGGSLSTSAPNVTIVEPDLFVDKSANPTTAAAGTAITFTLFVYHTPQSQTDAFDVVVSDVIPSGLTYVPCTLSYSGLAPDVNKRPADPCNLGTTTLTLGWDTFPLGQTSTITFQATMNGTQASVTNTASVAWSSLPIDPGAGGAPVQLSPYNSKATERVYDPGDPVNIYRVSDSVTITSPVGCPTCVPDSESLSKVKSLPSTGFAPNLVTNLPEQPATMAYSASDVWLEVPSLKLKMPIVGIPMVNDQWDVTWLTKQAGWLNGTSFPTWVGNSVLTSHVYLADGKPGPFVNLGTLKYGDKIIVHAYGNAYTYEVRENKVIAPNDTSVLGHKDAAWVTLITCKTYNQSANTYENRIAVQAELVSVKEDTATLPSNRGR